MTDTTDGQNAGAPLLSGFGSIALLAGILWYDEGYEIKYILLAAACALYLASAVKYYFKPDA